MRRLTLLAGFFCFMAIGAQAQQDPQFTQFMQDRLSINPGVAGSKESICATAIGRKQWNTFQGAPNTGLLDIYGPLQTIHSGIGLTFYADNIGQFKYTVGRLAYAYHLKIGGSTKLGLGVSLGFISSSINPDWIAYDYSGNTQAGIGTGVGDPSIPQNAQSSTTFDASFGAYFYNPKYYVGVSATHLNASNLKDVGISLARHYYLMAGYKFDAGSQFQIQPNILAKSDITSTQFDANVNVLYNNSFWVGLTYRTQDALAPQVGYQYQAPNGKSVLRIGYSYDVTTSDLKNYSAGSHEIMLSYCIKIEKPLPKRIYKNVRFL